MTDQNAYLVAICRLFSGVDLPELPDRLARLPNETDLFALLQYHQLLSIAYHYREPLATRTGLHFSAALLEELKNYALMNISRIMLFEHYLQQLDELFRKQGIDYRLFKGMVTARAVYPRDYLRSFGDIDLLIQPENLTAVETLLQAEGFGHADDLYRIFPIAIIRKYSFAQHFIRREPGYIALDIHLNLSGRLHPFQFDQQDFWENSQIISINGREFRTFDREHQAVYTLYHSFKHYFFKLIWFIDCFLLMDRAELDGEKFIGLIERYHLSRLLDYYGQITRDLFGRLPAVLEGRLVKQRSRHRMMNSDTILQGFLYHSPSRIRLLLPMYYLKSLSSRLRFLWSQLFPPMETVRDFYLDDAPNRGFGRYLKLRCRAIADLCRNRSREEYHN